MEVLQSLVLSVPVIQLLLLLLAGTGALLFGRIKLALLINYCFTLYWGYILNMDVIQETGKNVTDMFTYGYFGFGVLILALAMVGFISQRE